MRTAGPRSPAYKAPKQVFLGGDPAGASGKPTIRGEEYGEAAR